MMPAGVVGAEGGAVDRAMNGEPSDIWRTTRAVLSATAAVLFAVLAYQVTIRIAFPCDFLIWSESPHLTNLMKLAQGSPIYGPPADANSFVYSPGLEYVTYAVLWPFGLHLDVRFCRLVTVLAGVVAAAAAACFQTGLLRALTPSPLIRRGFGAMAFAVTMLLVFKSFTAAAVHPDDFYLLHLAAGLVLGRNALVRQGMGWSVVALVVLASGCLFKQSAAFGVVGGGGVLLLAAHRNHGFPCAVALAGLAVSAVVGALGALWGVDAWAKFYTFDLLSAHAVQVTKLAEVYDVVLHAPVRLVLLVAAPFALFVVWTHAAAVGRQVLLYWLLFGMTECAPSLAAYLKMFGLWNNLTVIDMWLASIVVPVLWWGAARFLGRTSVAGAAFAGALVLLVLGLVPMLLPPRAAHYAYAADVERHVVADVRAGRRVLLMHGTTPLVRAGSTLVPLDRANSLLELGAGGKGALAQTADRIQAQLYDRVYLNVPSFLGFPLLDLIEARYRESDRIPGVGARDWAAGAVTTWAWGFQPELWGDVRILEPKR